MASRRESWSRVEVEATVASYFAMLEAGLRGESVNKTAYRNALLPLLNGRNSTAVERKHQNISAILIEERIPYITGYKPLGNYQALLREVVLEQLWTRNTTRLLIETTVERVPESPSFDDILARWVAPPIPRPGLHRVRRTRRAQAGPPVDYVLLEARNRSLGRAGEEFVVQFEQARLVAARQERLASQIAHVSVTQGDGLGYDILSFGDDGRERLIEVKTTKFGEYTPFYLSRNELLVSQERSALYHLYRIFEFGPDPRLFVVAGALDKSFTLETSSYAARVN